MVIRRNPDETRERILEAAFSEIHRNGFRAASIDRILADTGLTKGALYHHFPNKASLGLAVIDEIIRGYIERMWIEPLRSGDDPVGALIRTLRHFPPDKAQQCCQIGCPLNNLAQEMSPVDEAFRQRLQAVYCFWRDEFEQAFRRGQADGSVRADIDCESVAAFLIAAIEGSLGVAKNARDAGLLMKSGEALVRYLESLRPAVPCPVPSSALEQPERTP